MIDLYILETCPYSIKVMNFLDANKINYRKYDVSIPQNREKLMELGGEAQVPFMVDDDNGITLYESDDIIEYVKNKSEYKGE